MSNKYVSQKFSGNPIKARIKRLYYDIFRRPFRSRLGRGTYIFSPFMCSLPDKMSIGDRVQIGGGAKFQLINNWFGQKFNPSLEVGDDTYIGANCEIVSTNKVFIGEDCVLSDYVYINDSSHCLNPTAGLLMDRPLTSKGPIVIKKGCFIGYRAIILSGVTLGKYCVIGAGAVVTQNVADYTAVAGSPAKVVSNFDLANGVWIGKSFNE